MDLGKHFDEGRIRDLAAAREVGPSRVLLDAAAVERDRVRGQIEKAPRRSSEDLREDVVYKLGELAALNRILGLPEQARALIEKHEEKRR